MTENELAKKVFHLGMSVHKELGPGLLESVYEECLYYELTQTGILTERQKTLPIIYKGKEMEKAYKIDLLVENKMLIELKSVDSLNNVHFAQTLTYLKLSDCKLGLLINFNVHLFKDGVKRIINGDL